jgi:cation:H+ antiporter
MLWINLLVFLILILLAAEIFVNALEHLGEALNISEGVTGSIFAAVGTALPETIVPLLAIAAGGGSASTNQDIGTGAILGAPLMLSTLSVSLLSFAVWRKRGTQGTYTPERSGLTRDLNTFIVAFSLALLSMFLPRDHGAARVMMAFILVLIYFIYVLVTLHASKTLVEAGHDTKAESALLLTRTGLPKHFIIITLQLLIGLGLLIMGAKGFIAGIQQAAPLLGISALLLSLMIVPIATELPEKINSILWIRRDKDTLAFGNITGAMVFQGTLLPAMGIALTSWTVQSSTLSSMVITLTAATWLRLCLTRGPLRIWQLWVNAALYVLYLSLTLFHVQTL